MLHTAIVDTVADRFYGDRRKLAMAFAELLNQGALVLQADGVYIVHPGRHRLEEQPGRRGETGRRAPGCDVSVRP